MRGFLCEPFEGPRLETLRRCRRIIALCATFIAAFATALAAQQVAPANTQLLWVNSDITVNPDSTLLVRETINALTTAQTGIYQDVLTSYSDRFMNSYAIHIDVVSLEYDDQPSKFYLRRIPDGLRIFMGNNGETPQPGPHKYELTYAVDRAVGFFPDHDELYWNVTGNGWKFPVQAVTARVHLPPGIVQQAIIPDAYTGGQASAGADYTAAVDNQGNAAFQTTRALRPHESLTIVLRWAKGFVSPPNDEQRHRYFLEDYQVLITGVLGLLVLVSYLALGWFLAGRVYAGGRPRRCSEPPAGYSPAALRCLWRNAFDQKGVIANLIDLAVKRQVAILEDVSGSYVLGSLRPEPRKSPAPVQLPGADIPDDEKLLVDRVFAGGDTLQLGASSQGIFGPAVEALNLRLALKLQWISLKDNARFLVPALAIAGATVVRCGYLVQGSQPVLVIAFGGVLLLWSIGTLIALLLAICLCTYALARPLHPPTARRRATVLALTGVAMLLVEVAGMSTLASAISGELLVIFLIFVLLICGFHLLLSFSQRSGRELTGEMDAFRRFLIEPEQASQEPAAAEPVSASEFEKLLPFAMALNAEKVWNEKFAAALARRGPGEPVEYSPYWYSGPAWDRTFPANFATSLGNSFFNAVTAALSPPGSRQKGIPRRR